VKLEAAKKFGATHTVNPATCDAVAEVLNITGGLGVDHALVAVAARGVKRMAFDMTAGWGQVTIVGHQLPENEGLGDINAVELLTGRRLTGSVMGAVTLRRDIPVYMDMYRRGLIDIDALLSNRFPLERIREALDDSTRGALKNVVVIGGAGL
jgi:S-(hydroxymethyl)glutathione dehydrogenase/alcohol dehydrogenase